MRKAPAAWLVVAAALLLGGCASNAGLRPVTSDGCSLYPDRAIFGPDDWCVCCEEHDMAYWKGGTRRERQLADQRLKECVAAVTGSHLRATTMELGVLLGGSPYMPTPFRWAYGWPYGRGYKPLTAQEQAKARSLESQYRGAGKSRVCK